MQRELNIKWVNWIDWEFLEKEEVYDILKNYDFHELDIEACIEENQTARIDFYDDYIFMIFHFPKFNSKSRTYELNEFNIFLWKNFLITLKNFWWNKIDEVFKRYEEIDIDDNFWLKITSGYILYEIIQTMLEKMFKSYQNIRKDIRILEKQTFDSASSTLVKDIMIKKRNIIFLKHMFKPQVEVMKTLENSVNKLFNWKMELYFEDLEDKLEHIVNNINILEEYINSVEDSLITIININTNTTIKLLTLFSAFMLPLTLITGFYWMNTNPLPLEPYNTVNYVFLWMFLTITIMTFIFVYFKKSWKL